MIVKDLNEKLGWEILAECSMDKEIKDGYTSDLMSDVMGNAPDDSVLITIQAHKNSVAVASLAGIIAIVLCGNRPCPDDMIEAAKEEDIAIFRTSESQYTSSWKIHELIK